MPERETKCAYLCSECGGDATRTRDRYPFMMHRSRASLWFVFFLLSFVLLWLVYQTIGVQTRDWTRSENLTPAPPAVYRDHADRYSLSLDQLRAALNGDEEAISLFRDRIKVAIQQESYYSKPLRVQQIRLEIDIFEGHLSELTSFHIFGWLGSRSINANIKDLRTMERADEQGSVTGYTRVLGLWPSITWQINHAGGVHSVMYDISVIHLLASITVLVWITMLLIKLPLLRNRPMRSFWCLLILLILSAAALAYTTRIDDSRVSSRSWQPEDTGAWYDAQVAASMLDDPSQMLELLRRLSEQMDLDIRAPRAVTLGYKPVYLPPGEGSSQAVEAHALNVDTQLTHQQLYSQRTTRFDPPRSEEQLRTMTRSGWWTTLMNSGQLTWSRNTATHESMIKLSLPEAVLICSIPWWIWIVLSRIHRFRTWRVQRKRVNRGQCIYCGYRATDEALAARWEDSPSPP